MKTNRRSIFIFRSLHDSVRVKLAVLLMSGVFLGVGGSFRLAGAKGTSPKVVTYAPTMKSRFDPKKKTVRITDARGNCTTTVIAKDQGGDISFAVQLNGGAIAPIDTSARVDTYCGGSIRVAIGEYYDLKSALGL